MIRSRPLLVAWSAVVAGYALVGAGWVAGAVFVGAYLAIAPGAALCRLLDVPRDGEWIPLIGASVSIDVVCTEVMVYAHVWTPLRGLVVLATLTAALVGVDRARSRARTARAGVPPEGAS